MESIYAGDSPIKESHHDLDGSKPGTGTSVGCVSEGASPTVESDDSTHLSPEDSMSLATNRAGNVGNEKGSGRPTPNSVSSCMHELFMNANCSEDPCLLVEEEGDIQAIYEDLPDREFLGELYAGAEQEETGNTEAESYGVPVKLRLSRSTGIMSRSPSERGSAEARESMRKRLSSPKKCSISITSSSTERSLCEGVDVSQPTEHIEPSTLVQSPLDTAEHGRRIDRKLTRTETDPELVQLVMDFRKCTLHILNSWWLCDAKDAIKLAVYQAHAYYSDHPLPPHSLRMEQFIPTYHRSNKACVRKAVDVFLASRGFFTAKSAMEGYIKFCKELDTYEATGTFPVKLSIQCSADANFTLFPKKFRFELPISLMGKMAIYTLVITPSGYVVLHPRTLKVANTWPLPSIADQGPDSSTLFFIENKEGKRVKFLTRDPQGISKAVKEAYERASKRNESTK